MNFNKNRGIMIVPNQLNILCKGDFYLYGIVIPFFRYFYLNLLKMQISTGNSEDCFLLFQLVWRLSEFAFLVRFTSVAALCILLFVFRRSKK